MAGSSAVMDLTGGDIGKNVPSVMRFLLVIPGDPLNSPAMQNVAGLEVILNLLRTEEKERKINMSDLWFLFSPEISPALTVVRGLD